jgi:hypothetical protein
MNQPQVLTNFVKEISQQLNIECLKFDDAGKNKAMQDMFDIIDLTSSLNILPEKCLSEWNG